MLALTGPDALPLLFLWGPTLLGLEGLGRAVGEAPPPPPPLPPPPPWASSSSSSS
eukprot:CAMPEP_0172636870 /NCGR_PEP_ID=MMETSP1068-20121228/206036_1 /TAXON_ID=35684 /ORGANISM="Pseudopedinella elastica, Strain CCMP716" /LENGTH=54 /DNA_ID=CAMNT_0013449391 /DNA_START=87 /DNA_END=248 /DNA_ORIENTATION=+